MNPTKYYDMTRYYLFLPCLLLCFFSYQSFGQRPKAVTDINRKGGSFPVGVEVINTGKELLFNAYDNKKGNQLYIYDGKSVECVSRFNDSYRNGRFEAEEQSKIALGAISHSFIQYKNSVIFSAMGELTKPSVYRYQDGGIDKLKSNLQTSSIYCQVGDNIYFIGSKKVEDDETEEITWVKGFYKIEDGESIQKLKLFDDLAGKIKSMCVSNGQLHFITNRKLYKYDGDNYESLQTFEADALESVVNIGGKVYVWAYKNRKKALMSAENGRAITSRLVKNRDRIGIIPPVLHSADLKVYVEDGYHRYNDLVLSNSQNFAKGEFPRGVFSGRAKVEEIQSFVWFEGNILICMKEKGRRDYNLWMYSKDTLIKYRFKRVKNIQAINYLNSKLYFTAEEGSKGRELYEYIPYEAPELVDQSFSTMEKVGAGTSMGKVKVMDLNGKIAKFKIVGGNKNQAFKIDEYTGEITVNNKAELVYRRNREFTLTIEVDNKYLSSTCQAKITLQESKYLNRNNLQERFLFFPDFTRPGILKTSVLNNGETIEIYNTNLRMIDKTVVSNGEIQLGNYPPGIYYLNANNGRRNFVQKMETN